MSDVLIELMRIPGQRFGIGFQKAAKPPYCLVNKLLEGGAALQSGKIQVGDCLLGINGKNLQHVDPEQLKEIMLQYRNDTKLIIEMRRTSCFKPNQNGDTPSIQVRTTSPNSPGISVSASRSPLANRRERRSPNVLPDINEDKPVDSIGMLHVARRPEHRQSLTPETHRKMPGLDKLKISKSTSLDLANLPQWRKTASQSVKLEYLIDGSETTDRLHNHEMKYRDTGCTANHCVGSQMNPKASQSKREYATPRNKEEILPLAEDFIKQYYDSKKQALGSNYDKKYMNRLHEVREEIEKTSFFDLTYEELSFGARTAWRNASRCVNRIVWRQLELLDARNVTTAKEMFEAVCHHIRYSNNGGNLRSTITVFAPRKKKNADFRVWNIQLISYAGYKNADNSILGDPARVEFTEVCMRLGWQPPKVRTAWDVLPLVLQASTGEPEIFDIPKEIVLDTVISHPDYDWFEKKLGLRWYALPAVSNVALDVGGIEFPAAPFSGWYMCTEIARDLGDANRYNKLKPIALEMGLNIQTYKLWKDRAMLELNVAILHSFQKARISVTDHHAATEGFMTHFKTETQSRGGCPADWVWIVPPISGSVTPVFHQEMLLYHLSPCYQYQDDPWKHYNFGVAQGRQKILPFKKVAFMVQKMMKIFGKIYQKRVKATILYASETGRSKNYASVVNDVFGRVFATKLMCMEDYDRANLEQEQMLLIVTSTFGSGDPPANGEMFGRYLLDLRNGSSAHGLAAAPTPRSHRMSTVVAPTREHLQQGGSPGRNAAGPLTQVKYCVFGLGSRAYPNFCTFAHTCDNLLSDLGAEKILSCGEGDELCGQEESFQAWLKQCYQEACAAYSLEQHLDDSDFEGYNTGYSSEKFRVMKYDNARPIRDECNGLRVVHSKDVYPAVLKSRVKLQPSHSDRSTIMAVLGMSGSRRLNYEPGDHVAIFPQNNHKVVTTLIDRLNPSINPDQPIFIETRRVSTNGDSSWVEDRRMPVPVTLREALTYYLDIANPPSAQFLKLLAKQATRLADKEALNELAKGGDTYEDWKYERFPSFCDVMDQFPSLKVDVTLLLQQLPLLQCRYYSISSSPKLHPDEVHVTVAVVSFRKRNGLGPRHNGVCSTWLNKVDLGEVIPCFIRKAHAFRMPKDPRVPIIMVGPGTGIAPFRSFWQDRIYVKNEALKMQLSMPSNIPTKPVQKKLQTVSGRNRRVTEYIAPNRNLLNTSPSRGSIADTSLHVFSSPQLLEEDDEVDGGNLKMCRSISDVDDVSREEIARVLANRQKEWGALSLYFGCRRSDLDHIYKDELKKARVVGGLDNVHVALSREPEQPKKYVQHLLKENADAVVHQLIEERGHFYVCGDISMAADVCRTLQSIFEENAAMSADQARKLIESMKDTGFYHEDIFGVTFKHHEVTTRVRTAAKKAWRILVNTGDSLMLPSPMTPHVRMPSPLPGAMPRHPLDIQFNSSTLPLRRSAGMSKRPTVTVLNTQKLTPTEQVDKMLHSRTSAPQLTPPKFVVPPRALSPVTGDNPILEPVVEVTSPKSPDTSTNEDKEESAESSSSEAVVSRQQSDESRQSRRIKTISSVESVV